MNRDELGFESGAPGLWKTWDGIEMRVLKRLAGGTVALLLPLWTGGGAIAHERDCTSPNEAKNIVEMFIMGRLDRIFEDDFNTSRVYWSSDLGLKYVNGCFHALSSHFLVQVGRFYESYEFDAVVINNRETDIWQLRFLEVRDGAAVLFSEELD